MSYYRVLGVSPLASQHQIKRAYREKAFKYHPDRNPNSTETAQRQFLLVQEAYETLKDPLKRREYDTLKGSSTSQASSKNSSQNYSAKSSYMGRNDIDLGIFSDFIDESSKFESKDALLAWASCYLLFINWDKILDLRLLLQIRIALLLVLILVIGVFAKSLSKVIWTHVTGRSRSYFLTMVIENSVAILIASYLVDLLSFSFDIKLTLSSLFPLCFASLLSGLIGASFGRAFAAGGSQLVGIFAGVVFGFISASVLSVYVGIAFIASHFSQNNFSDMKYAVATMFVAAIFASIVGSIQNVDVKIYGVLDIFENFFDRFRPATKVTDIAPIG